ncbi:MAG: YicC family protein [Candidatus Omnitrophica bacterium]|nr:YicC family protein [Candidatus Omnitrophota bacterium]
MTGFGASAKHLKGMGRLELQLRSINHRFLEIVFHLPEELLYLEDVLRRFICQYLSRGRITCVLKLNGTASEVSIFDETKLLRYYKQLKRLNKKIGLESALSLDLLLSLPGVVTTRPKYKDIPVAQIKDLFRCALNKLIRQRKKEGQALYQDLKQRLHKLHFYLAKLETRFQDVIEERAQAFVLPEEKATFLKNTDITEELVRIKFHLRNFAREMEREKAQGKELDFIAQELSREANTVSAKSIDAWVSSYVVKIKSEIDKIREQLQNVE